MRPRDVQNDIGDEVPQRHRRKRGDDADPRRRADDVPHRRIGEEQGVVPEPEFRVGDAEPQHLATAELPEAVRKYIKAHDGMLLANHGAVTCGPNVMAAYYKMETIEHFAKISLVARLLGREHLISREEVERLQGLRGFYGIPAPAPLCTDPAEAAVDQATCQVLEAPESTERLVPDISGPSRWRDREPAVEAMLRQASRDGEIRLTYGELTALIADAVKNLRD